MKNFLIVVSSFLFLLNSCSKENILSPVSSNSELLPLSLGNYWIYHVGIKDSFSDTTLFFLDTLKAIEKSERGILLKSRLQIILLDGYYKNGEDGLYMNDTLQFKYPGVPGEPCGLTGLGNVVDIYGKNPSGIILKTDFKYSYISSGDTISFNDCYYYFLTAFYPTENIKKTGYTIFKAGVGMVQRDWVNIDETVNEFYNPYAKLIDYHLN